MVRFRVAVADRARWFVCTKVESKGLAPHRNNQRLYRKIQKAFTLRQICRGLKRMANVRFCNCRLYMRLNELPVAKHMEQPGVPFQMFSVYRLCTSFVEGSRVCTLLEDQQIVHPCFSAVNSSEK